MRLDLGQQTIGLLVFLSLYLRTKAHTLLTGALLDDTPVSYTHLDVYKRQKLKIPLPKEFPK